MLDDILWNSDGFGVVDSLLLRSGIKDWWKKGQRKEQQHITIHNYNYNSENDNLLSRTTVYTTHPNSLEQDLLESMSLTRQLFSEFRPFFRMLDDAAFRPFAAHPSRGIRAHEDPFESFFGRGLGGRAAKVEMSEQPNAYLIEAELPGVKKENLDVSVGDHGRSITIEGRVISKSADAQPAQVGTESTTQQMVEGGSSSSDAVVQTNSEVVPRQEQWETRSSFSRTIWLPHAVDASKVSGKLEDGVLKLEIPKLVDAEGGRTKINVQ